MKLKHIIAAAVASAFFAAAAFAQQSPNGMQSPKASDAMQGHRAVQSDQSMRAGSSMYEGKMGAAQRSHMNVKISSAVIRQAQKKLNAGGYDAGSADGVWGPKTRAALKDFQKAKDLTPTGILDRQTLAALDIGNQAAVSKSEGMQTHGALPAR